MAANSFGQIFRITTWGESHGKAIGVVVDGCPAGLSLTENDINQELAKRAPGNSPLTSPRKETDQAEILSGTFEGVTTGAPISILIPNTDADPSKYTAIKDLMQPGHANYTYLKKYGVFDYRGGGRSSARETACRVAAGAIAKKLLVHFDITIEAWLQQVGTVQNSIPPEISPEMVAEIERVKQEGDSIGGIVAFTTSELPTGLGDPVYEKLEANLAKALLSIPASKGFEIGEGFAAAAMQGSAHNDAFKTTNHSGGLLGGISTGQQLHGSVAFKPTSSILKPQKTVDREGNPQVFQLPQGSRHDPCVAVRAVPVVEAMVALVLADSLLMNRSATL